LMHGSRWDISTKMFEKKTGSWEIFVAYNSYNVLGSQCSMLSQSLVQVSLYRRHIEWEGIDGLSAFFVNFPIFFPSFDSIFLRIIITVLPNFMFLPSFILVYSFSLFFTSYSHSFVLQMILDMSAVVLLLFLSQHALKGLFYIIIAWQSSLGLKQRWEKDGSRGFWMRILLLIFFVKNNRFLKFEFF
jgi:hypothetical protein